MHDSDQGIQDQRKTAGMEDSTMTIEFLRARLLSERAVSRTAKQRVDQLSKMVAELEEQLKIVSIQRKKAEKATADVLAILESQDLSDLSEDFDSSSDQQTPRDFAEGANSVKEEKSSVNSKVRRNESDDFSGSENNFSLVSGGRFSWKGRKGTSRSVEKCKGSMTRQISLTSTGSSPKHRMGKSCRQIRRREPRSGAEESKNESTKVGAQDIKAPTCSEGFLNFSNGAPDILQGGSEIREEEVSACLQNQRNITNGSPDVNEYRRDKDMERALEHQAQLIGQYVEMENAQREWEEKFRENNNGTPDSCDPGNHSDITEEREDIKAQAQSHAGIVTTQIFQGQEMKSQVEDVCFSKEVSKTPPNGFQQPLVIDNRYTQDQKERSILAYKSQSREFEFPMAGRQSQESLENYHNPFSQGFGHHERALGSQSAHESSSSREAEASGSRNDLYALVPHQQTEGLGGVLEALKHARLSLKHKINVNGLPLTEGSAVVKANPSAPATKTMDRVEFPIGCPAGLFRLPTDFPIEAHTQLNTLGSGSQLSLTKYYPDRVINPREQYLASPYLNARSSYMDTRPSFCTDRSLTVRQMDFRSRVPTETQNPYFAPSMDTGFPSTVRYTYSSHPNPTMQMPSNDGLSSRVPTSRACGTPPEQDQFSFYDDQNQMKQPSMYR